MIVFARGVGITKEFATIVPFKDRFLIFLHAGLVQHAWRKVKRVKLAAFVYISNCEEGNKKALENFNQQIEQGTIEAELVLIVGLPDAIHVGKSLKCSFANWYILLKGQRSNLPFLRTLRDDSDPETKKLFRKLLKVSETVRNKDRMAVDPYLT